ncbi:MAG: amino acid adenylation domain-containing protein [Elusimicrobia bacterium]|nr:amino acid adenylation domain-containing protein [Elusimicrobiota bacterium]
MGTLAGCFSEVRRRQPRLPAVACRGRELTYAELHAEASALAAELRRLGVRPGDRVGLYLERSVAAVAAVHACLMLGAAYVPVDPQNPWTRLVGLLEDCGARTLVTERRLLPVKEAGRTKAAPLAPLSSGIRLLLVDQKRPGRTERIPGRRAKGSDAAYILYTSGSTGKPKGVLMADRNAMAFVGWAHREFRLRPTDRVANLAPFQFDLSVFDIFNTCLAGACLAVIPYPDSLFAPKIGRFLSSEKITVFYTVPSVLSSIGSLVSVRPGAFPDLRLLLFAGEVLPPRVLRAWMALAPNAVFYNLYGPTETNVCLFHRVPRPSVSAPADANAIPIGRPLPGTRVRVLDEEGSPCKPGRKGELWVKGPTVMRGYAAGAVRPPAGFNEGGYYRTGDMVSLEDDGAYRFWGRKDDQVKVRGCRVDLGEVEAALAALPGIAEAAVTVEGEGERRALVAHVAPKPGSRASEKNILKALARKLPSYMLPSRVVARKAFPRLATGKIDRRGLSAAAGISLPEEVRGSGKGRRVLSRVLVQARGVLEEKVLRGRTLRDDESFWESGSLDSLDLLQFVHHLEKAFALKIPETDINPSVFSSLESVSSYLAKKVQ